MAVKEGRSKEDQQVVVDIARAVLFRLCGTDAAADLTHHFLVNHAFEIANAFADEIEADSETLFQNWKKNGGV